VNIGSSLLLTRCHIGIELILLKIAFHVNAVFIKKILSLRCLPSEEEDFVFVDLEKLYS